MPPPPFEVGLLTSVEAIRTVLEVLLTCSKLTLKPTSEYLLSAAESQTVLFVLLSTASLDPHSRAVKRRLFLSSPCSKKGGGHFLQVQAHFQHLVGSGYYTSDLTLPLSPLFFFFILGTCHQLPFYDRSGPLPPLQWVFVAI